MFLAGLGLVSSSPIIPTTLLDSEPSSLTFEEFVSDLDSFHDFGISMSGRSNPVGSTLETLGSPIDFVKFDSAMDTPLFSLVPTSGYETPNPSSSSSSSSSASPNSFVFADPLLKKMSTLPWESPSIGDSTCDETPCPKRIHADIRDMNEIRYPNVCYGRRGGRAVARRLGAIYKPGGEREIIAVDVPSPHMCANDLPGAELRLEPAAPAPAASKPTTTSPEPKKSYPVERTRERGREYMRVRGGRRQAICIEDRVTLRRDRMRRHKPTEW